MVGRRESTWGVSRAGGVEIRCQSDNHPYWMRKDQLATAGRSSRIASMWTGIERWSKACLNLFAFNLATDRRYAYRPDGCFICR
jgi:hypothetical protein